MNHGRWAGPLAASWVLAAVAISCVSTEARVEEHLRAAREHYRSGSMYAALEEYQRAIRLDPENVRARNNAAGIYYSLGDRESAIREYKEAIRLDPSFHLPKSSLASIYLETGEYAEAETLLEDLSRRVQEEGVFIRLGQAAALQGKHQEAVRHLERGLRFFGGSVDLAREIAIETEKIDRPAAVLAWDRVARLLHRDPSKYAPMMEALSAAFAALPKLAPETMTEIIGAAREAFTTGDATLEDVPPEIASSPVGISFFRPGEAPGYGYGEGGSLVENLEAAALEAKRSLGHGAVPAIHIDIVCAGWIPFELDWDVRELGDRPVVVDVRPRGPFNLGAFSVRAEYEDRSAAVVPAQIVADGWESFYKVYRDFRGRIGVPAGDETSIQVSRGYTISFADSGTGEGPLRLFRMGRQEIPIDPDSLEKAYRKGADYLAASVKEDGSFVYLYNAVKDETEEGYNLARHAGTTLALFELAEVTGEERYREAGQRALDYLLEQVKEMPGRGGSALEGGRVGPTALALIAALKGKAEERVLRGMGKFLLASQRQNGRFDPPELATGGPPRSRWAPGQAVLALTRLHARFDDSQYLEAARRGAEYIVEEREQEGEFILDHWFVQAVEDLDPIVREPRHVRYAYRIADALASYVARPGQTSYPDWVGGLSSWGQEPKGAAGLGSLEAILAAYRISVRKGRPREPLREAAGLCAGFALRLQYREETSFYLPSPSKALGGFRQGLMSPRIRIDGVQHAALALVRLRAILLEEEERVP